MDSLSVHDPQNLFVFVYGTLKRGHPNYNFYIKGSSQFISETTVQGAVLLTDGVLPYCVRSNQETDRVQGEVYQISEACLKKLDRLENHPHWYQREKVIVDTSSGTPLEAWVYFVDSNHPQIRDNNLTPIPDGIWRMVPHGEQI